MSDTVQQAAPVRARAEFISAIEAARRAQVTQPTMHRWCVTGIVRARKIVGRWRIDPHDLERLLEGDA